VNAKPANIIKDLQIKKGTHNEFPEIFYLITFPQKKEALPSLYSTNIRIISDIVKHEI